MSNFFGFPPWQSQRSSFVPGSPDVATKQRFTSRSEKIQPLGTLQYLLLVGLGILALTAAGKSCRFARLMCSFSGENKIQQGQVALGSDDILNAIKKRPQEASYYSTLGNYYASVRHRLAGQNQTTQAATLAVEADALLASGTQSKPSPLHLVPFSSVATCNWPSSTLVAEQSHDCSWPGKNTLTHRSQTLANGG